MTDLVISENDLQTYDEYVDSLEHHGILGQKWGRQMGPPYPLDSEDHSASEKKAGWRESLENATKKIREATEAIKNKNKKSEVAAQNEPKKEETPEERAEREKAEKRAVITSANANVIKENASKLTTQELQEAVNRMNLMAQIDSKVTTPPTIMDKINNAVTKADEVATLATKGVETYNKIARLYNKFQDPPLPVLDKTAAERAKEATDAAKKAQEEARKELIDKAIRSEDPDKIAKIRKEMTYQELNDFNNRMNAVDTLMKRTKGEKDKVAAEEAKKKADEEAEKNRVERIREAAKSGDYDKLASVIPDIKDSKELDNARKLFDSTNKTRAEKEAADKKAKAKAEAEAKAAEAKRQAEEAAAKAKRDAEQKAAEQKKAQEAAQKKAYQDAMDAAAKEEEARRAAAKARADVYGQKLSDWANEKPDDDFDKYWQEIKDINMKYRR